MAEWIVRVEAVNFGATIFDTNDLSTMRGGSLAALDVSNVAIDALREIDPTPRPVYAGASQCAFCISAGSEEAATRAAVVRAFETRVRSDPGAPHAHMVHVIDIAPAAGPDDAAALQTAEARNRTRQFREWTQAPIALSVAARDADRLDRVRPATDRAYFPKDPVLVSGDPEGQTGARGAEQRDVSPSVKARRQFGRDARQRFYGKILGDRLHPKLAGTPPDLHFAHDFQDIVASPPHEAGLSVRNKIAVVYADGNGFGDARGKVGTVAFGGSSLSDAAGAGPMPPRSRPMSRPSSACPAQPRTRRRCHASSSGETGNVLAART